MTRDEAKQLLPIIEAFANGKDIEIQTGGQWSDLVINNVNFNIHPNYYRIKPKYIEINGLKVPMPVQKPLRDGETYFIPSIAGEDPSELQWNNDNSDNRWLKLGIIHKTKEAAQIHMDALISFTKQD